MDDARGTSASYDPFDRRLARLTAGDFQDLQYDHRRPGHIAHQELGVLADRGGGGGDLLVAELAVVADLVGAELEPPPAQHRRHLGRGWSPIAALADLVLAELAAGGMTSPATRVLDHARAAANRGGGSGRDLDVAGRGGGGGGRLSATRRELVAVGASWARRRPRPAPGHRAESCLQLLHDPRAACAIHVVR